jgi:hypothetical protein
MMSVTRFTSLVPIGRIIYEGMEKGLERKRFSLTEIFSCIYVMVLLRYKSAGRGLDSRWCHWNFSVT